MISVTFETGKTFEALSMDVDLKGKEDISMFSAITKETGLNIAKDAQENVRKNKNVDTQKLLKSINSTHLESENMIESTIKAGASHAVFIEEGTKAHVIRPKNKSFLAFYADGKQVFAKKVNHPGTKAYPFLEPAVEKNVPAFIEKLEDVIENGRY